MNLTREQAGFTLIELVIVVVILGILAVVAVPKFEKLNEDVDVATCKLNQCEIKSIAANAYAESALAGIPAFPESLAVIASKIINSSTLKCPSGGTYTYDASTGTVSCDQTNHDL